MHLLKNEKFLFFVGGVAATLIGKTFLKSKTAHDLAVKGVAVGMKVQKDALEKFQNIKEDATDLYMDKNGNVEKE